MVYLHVMETNCVQLYQNLSKIAEVMVWTNLYGRTHTYTHTRMYIHRTVIVTTMSHSPQAGLTKIASQKKGLVV